MAKKDYYKVLGITKTATSDEIRQAYRKLAKKYHPDVSSEPNAEEKFKEVQEAYACLSDEQKRAKYDRFGHDGVDFGGQDFSNFGSYQDIFNEFFSSFGFGSGFSSFFGGDGSSQRQSHRSANSAQVDGDDQMLNLTISFDEAVHGVKKTISIEKFQTCQTCNGTGADNPKAIKRCPKCGGRGTIVIKQNSIFGQIQTQSSCPQCYGKGTIITEKCKKCGGAKVKKISKRIEITIPAGVDNGTHLRVKGYGNDGINGGKAGDLFIKFSVNPSSKFERKGNDIYSYLSISISQAVLGDTISIETIHGFHPLSIPAGLKSGTVLKIRDKGIVVANGMGQKGDHYVVVNIVTPKNLTIEQTKLFQRLGEIDGSMPKKN